MGTEIALTFAFLMALTVLAVCAMVIASPTDEQAVESMTDDVLAQGGDN